jgi:hypothetical protein
MLSFVMVRFHSIVAAILVLAAATPLPAQSQPASAAAPVNFTVFLNGTQIGSEQVIVSASADGWTIRATGRLGPPVSLTTNRLELRYDRE